MTLSPNALLLDMLDAAIDAAVPEKCVPAHLPTPPRGRTIVIGAGKASAAMARAVEEHWPGPLCGLVVTRYGHAVPCERIEIVEASHPVPDAAGRDAAARILAMVQGLTEDDLVLCLISGGGSALLALPAPGISFEDKQAVNKALLRSGANIGEMNCVRKHLSAIKGGRLAVAAAPAQIVALLISDVPGDDPSVIASGPDGRRSDDQCRRARHHREIPHRCATGRPRAAAQRRRRDAEARRSAPRTRRHADHHDAAACARGGGGNRESRRLQRR